MSEPDDRDVIERVAKPLRAPEHVSSTFDARLLSGARRAVATGAVPWRQPQAIPLRRRTARGWLTRPRRIRVSPLLGLAAAAGFAGVVAGATLAISRGHGPSRAVASVPMPPRQEVVRFVIAMPGARSVALVGDFNGWNPASTPLVKDTAGRMWTISMPLPAGTYQYAFVVDGQVWLADPRAPIALEDEFGAPSSVLTVNGSRT